jgi:hypothetical protein
MAIVIFALSLTAVASSSVVEVTVDPGVTIAFNGQAQDMFDANGNRVYPIMYNGTTYLPVRAISNIAGLPIEWDNATRTVKISSPDGSTPAPQPGSNTSGVGVSALTVRDSKTHPWWESMSGVRNLPQMKDDFGVELNTFTEAFVNKVINSAGADLVLNVSKYNNITTTVYLQSDDNSGTATFTVKNSETDVVIYIEELDINSFITLDDIDVTGVNNAKITIVRRSGNTTGYLLNPIVK